MKKSLTKILALFVIAVIIVSIPCITTFSETVTTTVVTDDFNSYNQEASSASSLTTGGGRYVAKTNGTDALTWYASSSGFGATAARAGITASPTNSNNNVLAIESRSLHNTWNQKPRVIYQNLAVNSTDTYTYKFDFYKSDDTAGGGIVFNFSGSNSTAAASANYYAIDFNGKNDHAYGYPASDVYSTVVIKNGEYITDAIINTTPETTFLSRTAHDFIPSKAWYTMELTVTGGRFNWTVKQTSSGTTIQTGSWTDSTPITGTNLSFAFVAGGQMGQYMYFDNVSVTQKTNNDTTEPEPEPDTNGTSLYSDNFNSYAAIANTDKYITTNNAIVAGQWKTAGNVWGFNANDLPHVGIKEISSNNNVLDIEAKAAFEYPRYFIPVEPASLTIDTSYMHTYKFDIYRLNAQGGGGIRFNKTGSWGSFYELYFQGTNGYSNGTLKTSLSKLTYNAATNTSTYARLPETDVVVTGTLTNNMLSQNKWYTVEVTVNGGYIRWSVTETASGIVVQTGSFVDPEPLLPTSGTVALFGAGQGGNYTYFDNFSVTRSSTVYPRCDIYKDTLTVEFSPEAIDGIEDMEKLQVIAAFYESETDTLLSTDVREITDLSEYVLETFTVNPDYHYAKVFIWSGDLGDAIPAYKPMTIERERDFIITDVTSIGDPQVMFYDDTYYMYCTYSPTFGYYVRTSKDLINWSDPIMCYDKKEKNAWGQGRFWAPEVTYHNGKFIMHYSATTIYATGNYRIGVAVSDSPLGPFTDVHGKPMFDYGFSTIDASVLVTDSGNYLYYSKDGCDNIINGLNVSQTYCVEVDDTLTKVIGEPKLMITPEYDYELKSISVGQIWNEGPTVIEYTTKNGDKKYIMNYSANFYTTNDYAICMAVADDPLGPWVKPTWNPVLSNNGKLFGAGHNAFFIGRDGNLYSSFHVQTDPAHPGDDRRLCIGRIEFEEDEKGNIKQNLVGCIYKD